jgi:hypothetical protein
MMSGIDRTPRPAMTFRAFLIITLATLGLFALAIHYAITHGFFMHGD